jgi:NADH-quinone oxidoreductase subunit J
MNVLYYLSAAIAVFSTFMVVTRRNIVHALLYLITSLLAVALIFLTLGAPFVAALEVIIYAGAIMVLFVFVIMMLNLGSQATKQESQWLQPRIWKGPAVLCAILAAELAFIFSGSNTINFAVVNCTPKQVGIALLGPYVLGVELSSLLLLAGLIAAYHIGRPHKH